MRAWPKDDDPALQQHAAAPKLIEGRLLWLASALPGLIFAPIGLVTALAATAIGLSQFDSGIMTGSRLGTTLIWLVVGGLFLYVGAAAPLAIIWRMRNRRFALTSDAFLLQMNEKTIVWPLQQIAGVTIEKAIVCWKVKLRTRSAPMLCVTADQALALCNQFRSLGLTVVAPDYFDGAGSDNVIPVTEPALWSGRLGFFGVSSETRIALIMGGLFLGAWCGVIIWWLMRMWSWPNANEPAMAVGQVFASIMLLTILGGPFYLLFMAVSRWRMACVALFGEIVITARRIAWLDALDGHIVREIPLNAIASADVIEVRHGRAWVSLTPVEDGELDKDVDIHGVPRFDEAVALINRWSKY